MTTTKLSWQQVKDLSIAKMGSIPTGSKVYGVPRGGWLVALLIAEWKTVVLVDNAAEADYIVDDIEDSGETRRKWSAWYPLAKFLVLYKKLDKQEWVQFPWETDEKHAAEENMRRVLQAIGEDPKRDGLKETPARFVKALREMTSGLAEKPEEHLRKDFTLADMNGEGQYQGLILSAGIPFVSLCEHHLLPFSGQAHIAYVPSEHKRVVGLSKLARMFDGYARRPQVQERLTQQACDAMVKVLAPASAAVVVQAKHTCQCFRGVKKDGTMLTSALHGGFLNDAAARAELFQMIELATR